MHALESSETYGSSRVFSSTFLNVILGKITEYVNLTHRLLFTAPYEILELSRLKADLTTDDGIPITAATLLIRDDGLCKLCFITGKTEEATVDINDLSLEPPLNIPFLNKLSDSYVFCQGLPKSLKEIQCYESPFQFSQDYPYPHVRSKSCFVWYEQGKGISIRERIGMEKPRCSPCKKYLCVINSWCRSQQKKSDTKTKQSPSNKDGKILKSIKLKEETVSKNSSEKRKVQKRLKSAVKCNPENLDSLSSTTPKRKRTNRKQSVNVIILSNVTEDESTDFVVRDSSLEFTENSTKEKEGTQCEKSVKNHCG